MKATDPGSYVVLEQAGTEAAAWMVVGTYTAASKTAAIRQHTGQGADVIEGTWKASLRSRRDVVCSCGVPGCSELGWPHEWDPIAAGDSCIICGAAEWVGLRVDPVRGVVSQYVRAPTITAPYVRLGCGYAHAECAP